MLTLPGIDRSYCHTGRCPQWGCIFLPEMIIPSEPDKIAPDLKLVGQPQKFITTHPLRQVKAIKAGYNTCL